MGQGCLLEDVADRLEHPSAAEIPGRAGVALARGRAAVGAVGQQDCHHGDGTRWPAGVGARVAATVAARLVREHGHDLGLVADILGHADVETTRAYARSQLEDRREALEAPADD